MNWAKWPEFKKRYQAELQEPKRAVCVDALHVRAAKGDLTLLFAARDKQHCNAAVLLELLQAKQR